jgi:hypothetical protein
MRKLAYVNPIKGHPTYNDHGKTIVDIQKRLVPSTAARCSIVMASQKNSLFYHFGWKFFFFQIFLFVL